MFHSSFLNTLVHFDVAGFLMMIFFGYGWARPVPVNKNNFKNGRRSQFWVSIAGILMNLILGTVFLFIYMLIYKIDSSFYFSSYYGYMLEIFLFFSFQMNFPPIGENAPSYPKSSIATAVFPPMLYVGIVTS